MNNQHCTHCNHPNARYCGEQKAIEYSTRRPYQYSIYNCDDGCGSSFGTERHYTDGDCEPMPAKCEAVCNG